jgi:electron transfer flavoprotein alpha subunit
MTTEGTEKTKKPKGKARLIPGKCMACGARCQAACPFNAITMNEKGEPIIDVDKCTSCRRCVKVCPAQAIEIFYTPDDQKILDELAKQEPTRLVIKEKEPEDPRLARLREYKGVWVFTEHTEGKPAGVSWELLGAGANLAKARSTELCSVVIGEKIEHLAKEAFTYGASKVYLVDDPVFHYYRTQSYYKAMVYLIKKYKPEIVLVGATGLGRDLAGAIATELNTGLTADCTGLSIDDKGLLLQTRPAFGGNIMASILTDRARPQMSTVRPHVMPMPEKDAARTGEIIRETIPIKEQDIAAKVLEIISDEKMDSVDISTADILVSGGRGMCNAENYRILQELADELGGAVACSRAAVEAGWMPLERQVGQTGKTVRPKIYIAAGISGAIQHLVGMQSSDTIIAINRDKNAPIFGVATYGIVGDLFKIVPAITAYVREAKKKKLERLAGKTE